MTDHNAEPCPNGLTPDGPTCPRCGGYRGPSGVDGGSWVHCKRPEPATPQPAVSTEDITVEDFDVRWLERQRDSESNRPYERDAAKRVLGYLATLRELQEKNND